MNKYLINVKLILKNENVGYARYLTRLANMNGFKCLGHTGIIQNYIKIFYIGELEENNITDANKFVDSYIALFKSQHPEIVDDYQIFIEKLLTTSL